MICDIDGAAGFVSHRKTAEIGHDLGRIRGTALIWPFPSPRISWRNVTETIEGRSRVGADAAYIALMRGSHRHYGLRLRPSLLSSTGAPRVRAGDVGSARYPLLSRSFWIFLAAPPSGDHLRPPRSGSVLLACPGSRPNPSAMNLRGIAPRLIGREQGVGKPPGSVRHRVAKTWARRRPNVQGCLRQREWGNSARARPEPDLGGCEPCVRAAVRKGPYKKHLCERNPPDPPESSQLLSARHPHM
jgi:hypothetical protein